MLLTSLQQNRQNEDYHPCAKEERLRINAQLNSLLILRNLGVIMDSDLVYHCLSKSVNS